MKNFLRRLPPFETAAVVLAVIALAWFGVSSQQTQQAESPTYSTYDAAPGGYRAWYELLDREGVTVDKFERPPAFLDRAHFATLIWASSYLPSSATADGGALEDWVRAGGRFVYLGRGDTWDKRRVLNFPVTKDAKHPGAVIQSAWLTAAGVRRTSWNATVRWDAPKKAAVLVADHAGPLVIAYPFGHGQVVAVADFWPFVNSEIGNGDEARLAYAIAKPPAPQGVVAFDEAIHDHLIPEHWWEIVPRAFLIAVGLAALALVIAFSGAAIRLGPPLVPVERDATSLEFIDSFAALLERGRAARKALEDAADSTIRIVATALGLPHDARTDLITARISDAEFRGDFSSLVRIAGEQQPDDAALVRGVALAQRLRKEFETHARPRH